MAYALRDRQTMLRPVLLASIRFYRRRISGKGPLRRVDCTFKTHESCAAFAERVILEAPSALGSLVCIARRLKRCRGLSLYYLANGTLGWEREYDAVLARDPPAAGVRELGDLLGRQGEAEAVRAAVCRAAEAVVAASKAQASEAWNVAWESSIVVRDARAVRAFLLRSWRVRTAVVGIALLLALTAAAAGYGLTLVLVPSLVAVLSAASASSRRRSLRRLERLEAVTVPASLSERTSGGSKTVAQ
jgi:putative component of membrane protein insertase Oxa1/YidC/SpoIIIJ protein YidD